MQCFASAPITRPLRNCEGSAAVIAFLILFVQAAPHARRGPQGLPHR